MLAPSSDGCGTTVLHIASAQNNSLACRAAAVRGPRGRAARMFSASSARRGTHPASVCGPAAAAAAAASLAEDAGCCSGGWS